MKQLSVQLSPMATGIEMSADFMSNQRLIWNHMEVL